MQPNMTLVVLTNPPLLYLSYTGSYCKAAVSRMKFDERHAHPEQLLLAFADKVKKPDHAGDSSSSSSTITSSSSSSGDEEGDKQAVSPATVIL